jgi:hypothetical protein
VRLPRRWAALPCSFAPTGLSQAAARARGSSAEQAETHRSTD